MGLPPRHSPGRRQEVNDVSHAFRWGRALLAIALVPVFAAAQPSPHTTINLVVTDTSVPWPPTSTWIEAAGCDELVSAPITEARLVWVVVSDPEGFPDGLSALQFGIEHDLSGPVAFSPANPFQALQEEGWPASGTSIALARLNDCPSPATPSIRVGYFFLQSGASGTLSITPDHRTGAAEVVDCRQLRSRICDLHLGSVDVAQGGNPACEMFVPSPPTDVAATTGICPIEITWSHDGADVVAFRVTRNGLAIATTDAGARAILDDTPQTDETLSYRVVAVNACGAEGWSEAATGSGPAQPPPTNCQATLGECDVRVTWEGADNAIQYRILRSDAPIAYLPADAREYVDTDAHTWNTRYAVVAVGRCGATARSNEAVGARGTIGVYASAAIPPVLCESIHVSWYLSGNIPPDGFTIARDGVPIAELGPDAREYVDTDAIPDSAHVYEVVALNACEAVSDTVVGYPAAGGPLTAPIILEAIPDACGRVRLEWMPTAVFESYFRVYRDGEAVSTRGVTFWSDHVAPGGTYTYHIVATNACGDSPPSDPITVDVPLEMELPAPAILSPPDGYCPEDSVTYIWRRVPGAWRYALQRTQESSTGTFYTADTTLTLPVGSVYPTESWQVAVLNLCYEPYDWSEVRYLLYPGTIPAPADLTLSEVDGTSWAFAWSAIPGVHRYELTLSAACHELVSPYRIVEVAGTDTTLVIGGPGGGGEGNPPTPFAAWVSAIACGEVQEPSACVFSDDIVPVLLETFDARVMPGAIVLSWRMGDESDAAAYVLYRESPGSTRTAITPTPIPAGATAYRYEDATVAPDRTYTYTLVSLAGNGTERELATREVRTSSAPAVLAVRTAPNPFNPRTLITIDLPAAGRVVLDVLDPAGRRVRRLLDQSADPGRHTIAWDSLDRAGREVGSGVYFLRLETPSGLRTRRITLLR